VSNFLTNRGKLNLVQGKWDTAGATAVKIGLLKTAIGSGADTAAEVADFNTVADLTAATGVVEAAFAGYTRKSLTRTNATEDDTNDRVNMDASDVTWTAAPTGETIVGFFYYDATTDTNDTTRILWGVGYFASGVPTNGSDLTLTIADLIRAS
jgi:hypothetical protein